MTTNTDSNESYKEQIFNYIKSRGSEPVSSKEIMEATGLSYVTISKWLLVLEAVKCITVKTYGSMKFYYYNKDSEEGETQCQNK